MSLPNSERPRRVVALILGVAVLAATPLQAGVNRWTSIGPYGGSVTALAFSANGRTALAGTRTLGVFRSVNNGRTWTPASSGLSGEVVDLAASPAAPGWVYAATSSGVFRSDDAGLHWTAADAGLPSVNGQVNAARVATEPTQPTAVWAALRQEQALYRSANRGARWRYAGQGLQGFVHDVAAHPQTAGVVFAATSEGLFRSADFGGHWSPSGLQGLVVSRVVFDRVQPRHLYAITVEEGSQQRDFGTVFVSDDGGASWKDCSQRLTLYQSFELAADPARAGTAWLSELGGSGSIFKTRDGGQHWQRVLEGNVSALAVNPLRPGTVLAGQESTFSGEPALVRTDDGGTSWSPSHTGIAAQLVEKVLPDPSKPGALYAEGCCALWKRTGAGQPFTPFVPAIPDSDDKRPDRLIVDPKTPSTLYLVSFGNFLYKSVDAGATWQQISNLYSSSTNAFPIGSITIDPAHPSTLYGLGRGLGQDIFYRSDDGGFSWHALSGSVGREARLMTVTATAVYACSDDDQPPHRMGLRRSTDGGTTWTTLLNFDSDIVQAVAEDQNDPRRLWTAMEKFDAPGITEGIYRSTDGGVHWSLSRLERFVFALAVDPRNSNRIWAASVGTVFLSEDGGATWVSFGEGLPATEVFDLRLDPLDPDTLYAGTNGGSVYELTRQAGE
jgi:photosystem II stability/assembly factor-like uncharacterized protein